MPKFDVLSPQLVWIDNRCYRKFKSRQESEVNPEDEEFYGDTPVRLSTEEDSTNIRILRKDNNFWITKQIPSSSHEQLQKSIKKLRMELRSSIDIPMPRRDQDCIDLTIKAKTARAVSETFRRIDVLLEERRRHLSATHFISIPMNNANVQEAFANFKQQVLLEYKDARGVTESIFQNPEKLHLTLTMLLLEVSQEKERAKEMLEKCKEDISKILRRQPLMVQMKGIEYMNDDPEEVDVLFAKVNDANNRGSLQAISDHILKDFQNTNLCLTENNDSVKLHVTLMNTIFRSAESDQERKPKIRQTFDARPILQNFMDYNFGTISITEIHLSVRYTTGENGYYIPMAVLKI